MGEEQTLPSEILLLIVECAALHATEDPLHMGWAASLCLVCRSFHSAVTPIIYAHVVVTKDNFKHLFLLAHQAPAVLCYARSVTLHSLPEILKHGAMEYLLGRLTHLRAFTGSGGALALIYIRNKDTNTTSVFIKDVAAASRLHSDFSRCPWMQKATRLHIVILLHKQPRPDEPIEEEVLLEYLMVDVLAAKDAGWDLTPNLLEYLGRVLNSIESLRRILLRPRCLLPTFTAERFYSVVEEWAAAARDPRIWVENSGPSWINHDGSHIHEELHVQDAVVGDELWLRGRQLYLPSVPAPLANEQ